MYLQESWNVPNEDKKNEGEAIRNSLGSVLELDSNLKGMHLKLKHNRILLSANLAYFRHLLWNTFCYVFGQGKFNQNGFRDL